MRQYFIILALLLGPVLAQAKEFSIVRTDIDIRLQQDGSLVVHETRTFRFSGRFSEVYRSFPKGEDFTFGDFQVSENGEPYTLSDRSAPGNMQIDQRSGETLLSWFFDARDTLRSFTVTFRVEGAVERYEDAAVLYYQVIGDAWEVGHEDVTVTIYPPEYPSDFGLKQWWHGSYNIFSEIIPEGIITSSIGYLEPGSIMEVRALYPPDMFPNLDQQAGMVAEEITEQEAMWAEEANLRRLQDQEREQRWAERHETGKKLIIPLVLAYILLWVWLYRRYGRDPRLSQRPGAFSGLPSREHPALVAYLMGNTYIGAHAMVATIFHLASRGFLRIVERDEGGRRPKTKVFFELNTQKWEAEKQELTSYERSLPEFLFVTMGNGHELDPSVLKKKPRKMQAFYAKWEKLVKEHGEKTGWFDKQSTRIRNMGALISLLSMALSAALVFVAGPLALIIAALAFVTLVMSLVFQKRTEKGELEFQKWKSLKAYLKRTHFDPETMARLPENVSDYLVYGIALGLGSAWINRLTANLDSPTHQLYLAWIVIHLSHMNTLGKTVNEVVTTTSSALTTPTGGGGTMGGGGGVSAGGGGAR